MKQKIKYIFMSEKEKKQREKFLKYEKQINNRKEKDIYTLILNKYYIILKTIKEKLYKIEKEQKKPFIKQNKLEIKMLTEYINLLNKYKTEIEKILKNFDRLSAEEKKAVYNKILEIEKYYIY